MEASDSRLSVSIRTARSMDFSSSGQARPLSFRTSPYWQPKSAVTTQMIPTYSRTNVRFIERENLVLVFRLLNCLRYLSIAAQVYACHETVSRLDAFFST